MLTTDNLEIHHRYEAKATAEFDDLCQKIDDLLQKKKDIYLNYPVDIYLNNHLATWDYISMTDDEEEEEESYPFNDITFGLYVKTKYIVGEDYREPYLRTFIGNSDGEPIIEFNRYYLGNKLNLVKITNELATAVATIRNLELFISNMGPQRGEIVLDLLSNLLNC